MSPKNRWCIGLMGIMPIRTPGSANELEEHYSFCCGCIQEGTSRERSAIAYYRSEIHGTGYFKARFNLARLLSSRGRVKEAVEQYKAVARSADRISRADALNNLGNLYLRLRRTREALDCFRRSSRLDPTSAAPRVNAALTYLRAGRVAQGRAWLERAEALRRLDPEVDLWIAYAEIEYGLDVRRGVRVLELAAARKRVDRNALLDLAVGYFRLGDTQRAQSVLKKVAHLSPLTVDERRRLEKGTDQHRVDAWRLIQRSGDQQTT